MDWAKSTQRRDQMVLFPTRLDDAIAAEHNVRLLDDILHRLDGSKWEMLYNLRRGQPRILAGVILYGLLTRIRSSRALEEALQVRLDFRWLVDGTRVRANNRRSGTRTPARLREMKKELAAKYAELEARTAAAGERPKRGG